MKDRPYWSSGKVTLLRFHCDVEIKAVAAMALDAHVYVYGLERSRPSSATRPSSQESDCMKQRLPLKFVYQIIC
jgi:hypothetical protein